MPSKFSDQKLSLPCVWHSKSEALTMSLWLGQAVATQSAKGEYARAVKVIRTNRVHPYSAIFIFASMNAGRCNHMGGTKHGVLTRLLPLPTRSCPFNCCPDGESPAAAARRASGCTQTRVLGAAPPLPCAHSHASCALLRPWAAMLISEFAAHVIWHCQG